MADYAVVWTEPAIALLERLTDKRVQSKLLDVAETLTQQPHQRGRALRDEFDGYWSMHWSRYRILYIVDETRGQVRIAAIGLRAEGKPKDVYEVARKLLGQGLLEPPPT